MIDTVGMVALGSIILLLAALVFLVSYLVYIELEHKRKAKQIAEEKHYY